MTPRAPQTSSTFIVTVSLAALLVLATTFPGCDNSAPPQRPVATTQPQASADAVQIPAAEAQETAAATQPQPSADAEMVEIEIDLPPAMFLGTPKQAPANTTALSTLPPREPLLAPAGAHNVALNKPVTCSDAFPIIGELQQVTDGDKSTADGSYVELSFGKQWLQIDLETPTQIYGIALWHFHSEPRVYRDVIVQLADDADFTTNVRTIFNNDQDDTLRMGVGVDREYFETNEGHLIYVTDQTARFLRLYSRGNTTDDQNHYIEVEVFGLPIE
jgi:hypothetical protein